MARWVWAVIAVWVGSLAAAGDAPIGTVIDNVTLKDIRYLPRTLDDFGQPKVLVLAFITNTCPLARRYLPKLVELDREFAPQGVQFLVVNVGPDDAIMDVAYHALEFQAPFPMLKDMTGNAVRKLGMTRTPEVAVLDAQRALRYRGRVDDQYRLGGVKPTVGRADLREAIMAVLAGKEVEVSTTPADGCSITFPPQPAPDPRFTYAEHIAPILNARCAACHHDGGSAPFALTSLKKAAAHAEMIAEVVGEGRMPPWYAHPEFGTFENERRLTPREKSLLLTWVASGCPEGDAAQAPASPVFEDNGWAFVPDAIIEASTEIALPASGFVDYRYVFLPYEVQEDTWVRAIQILASNPRVLHHANLFFQSADGKFERAKHFLTGTVPGNLPRPLPEGMALLLPKGAKLGLQIHYVTTGKPETDRPRVGVLLSKSPVRQRVYYKILDDESFKIPPGDPMFAVRGAAAMEEDVSVVALFGHMHLRGRDMTFRAKYLDGREEILLCLPNYSFDWQLSYYPPLGQMKLAKGAELECVAHFDNSRLNPYNPDPAKTVEYGPQTVDEMMQGFIFYTRDNEALSTTSDGG
ncbi:MAG: redoxin domain-containing protein [Candidatus Hydrogenedentes bacterium]|nr:redoxin domain-containing protein [Candidatus Hydrogenedentota bacterium]